MRGSMTVIVSRMSRTPGLASLAWGRRTASRLVRANIKSRFEKRKTNGSLLSTIVTSTASRTGPKGSCSARALVDAQAAEVRALSKCRFNAHRNVLLVRPSTSASAVSRSVLRPPKILLDHSRRDRCAWRRAAAPTALSESRLRWSIPRKCRAILQRRKSCRSARTSWWS